MILKKLKFNAFGPFKDKHEIDFTCLNNSGIFLLTGETGVGKTAVFDAITFALYGDISGSNLDIDRVRSDYADESNKTYVGLEFEVNNCLYEIYREPQQFITGKSGKAVIHGHSAFLKYEEKQITGPKEVTSKIIELLGLNLNQFRQIVMIPQGEFMKLLTSSSEEKVKIFRQIFKTKNLLNFEEGLNNYSKELFFKIEKIKIEIESYFNLINIKNENMDVTLKIDLASKKHDEIKEELNRVSDEKDELFKYLDNLTTKKNSLEEYNKKIKEYKKNKSEYDELLKTKDVIDDKRNLLAKSSLANEVRKIVNRENKIKDDLSQRTNNVEISSKLINEYKDKENELNEAYTKLLLDKNKIDEIKNKYVKLNEKKNNYDEYKKCINKIEEISIEISRKNKRKNDLSILYGKYINDYEKTVDTKELIENKRKNLVYLKIELNQLLEKKSKFEFVKEKTDKLNECKNEANLKADEIKQRLLEQIDKETEINDYKKRLLEDKAYILSISLKPNMPCPVCGSLIHPKKALPSDIEVNDEIIEEKQMELITINNIISELKVDINSIYEKMKLIESAIDEKNIEYDEDVYAETTSLINDKQNIIEGINAFDEEYEKLVLNETNLSKKLDEINDENSNITEKLNELNIEQARLDSMIKSYEMMEINDLEEELISTKTIIEEYDNKVKEIKEDTNTVLNNIQIEKEKIKINNDFILKFNKDMIELEKEKNLYSEKLDREYEFYLLDDIITENYNNQIIEFDKSNSYYVQYFKINESLNDKEESSLKEIEDSILECNINYKLKLEEYAKLKQEVMKYQKTINDIKALVLKNEKSIILQERVNYFSKITNGDNRLKMSFEKYVLAIYFEDILEYANKILKNLTNRYTLVRRDTKGKGNSHQGLDLDVFDYDTGIIRSVKTLSGGETFKASLALALGLSELIKSKRSQVDINTMFIDEGFGTLDSESLDQAINMLLGFKEEGLKIGIISHISELKTRIQSKIIISRGINGSSVRVVGE